ncbi:uncharacterized protein RJT21DRAFT_38609 [Scheffersomyces amazonensis]|uniref:uncharacterized protein n=1 Tax=Scheffersomyces amazonensis TaxID=1078765 RepID=UPI00315CDD18
MLNLWRKAPVRRWGLRFNSGVASTTTTTTTTKPPLLSILPKKKVMNKLLFDNDSRFTYSKTIPILQAVYENLDNPDEIVYPSKVNGQDLMVLKSVLTNVRTMTNTINKNLLGLENELVEQAAEMGDNDAVALLMYEVLCKSIREKDSVSDEDEKYASETLYDLIQLPNLLAIKLMGNFLFSINQFTQAKDVWKMYLKLDNDSIQAAQVYSSLGAYYMTYEQPTVNLGKAKICFENAIRFGILDDNLAKTHYYLGQLYSNVDPEIARYHWEISATKSLVESFSALGFLELNTFQNYSKSVEWFKLGVETSKDVVCMIGLFDVYYRMKDNLQAFTWLGKITAFNEKLKSYKKTPEYNNPEMKAYINNHEVQIEHFFKSRSNEINDVTSNVA